jgi:hypothetical protein
MFFARNHAELGFPEPGGLEPAIEIGFRKPEPVITVESPGLLEAVLPQIKDHDLSARLQDAVRAGDGASRIGGVMQGLTEDDQIHRTRRQGRILEIAEAKLEVLQADPPGFRNAERDDSLRVVDGNHSLATSGEEFADQAFAGAEVGHRQRREDPQQEMAQGLPGAAGAINAIEAAGDLIEIDLGLVFPQGQDAPKVDTVGRLFGEFAGATNREVEGVTNGLGGIAGPAVERALAVTTGFEEAGVMEQAEVGGDPGLPHAGDFLEFVDAEFGLFEEGDEAQSGGVGEGADGFEGCVHENGLTLGHEDISSHPDTSI